MRSDFSLNTISSYCILVVWLDDTSGVYDYYCFVLYCIVPIKYEPQPNETKPFLTPIKPMYAPLLIYISYLFPHAVTNVRYSVNYKHHNRRYFQHAHFIPVVGVGKRGAY